MLTFFQKWERTNKERTGMRHSCSIARDFNFHCWRFLLFYMVWLHQLQDRTCKHRTMLKISEQYTLGFNPLWFLSLLLLFFSLISIFLSLLLLLINPVIIFLLRQQRCVILHTWTKEDLINDLHYWDDLSFNGRAWEI